MRNRCPQLRPWRALALSLAALLGRIPAVAGPEEDYLVRAYVPARDGFSETPVRIVSLVPEKSKVRDPDRLPAWRHRLAEALSGSDSVLGNALVDGEIEVRDMGRPIPIRLERAGLALPPDILSAAKTAIEVMPPLMGAPPVTNRYSVLALQGGGRALQFRRTGSAADSALLPSRTVGHGVWLLSREELFGRWERNLATDPRGVRGEISALEDSGAFDGPGGAAWRRSLMEWVSDESHRALWPRVLFDNRCPHAVEVGFLGGRRTLLPGEVWTNSVPAVPRERLFWSFLPLSEGGSRAVATDFEFNAAGFGLDWSPLGRMDVEKTIHDDLLRPKRNPYLELGPSVIPSAALRKSLRVGDLLVRVKYSGGQEPVQIPVNDPVGDVGGSGLVRYVEIDPHRKVDHFEIDGGRFWKAARLIPAGGPGREWNRGDRIETLGTVELRPWPVLVVSNPAGNPKGDRDVAFELSVFDSAGVEVHSVFPPRIELAPGETRRFDGLGRTIGQRRGGDDALSYVLRAVAGAAYAASTTNEAEFVVGGGDKAGILRFSPMPEFDELPPPPEPERLPWFAGSSRDVLVKSLYKRILREYPFDRESDARFAENAQKKADEKAHAGDDPVGALREHLGKCGDPACHDCAPFRARNGRWLPSAPGEAPDFGGALTALYHDWLLDNPGMVRGAADADSAADNLRSRFENARRNAR